MRKACGVEVLLFEIAHCLWICSSFYSNFEKQNRKGSPQSLIYPYNGKLTSFVIKQFFRFGRVHQTLSRSRLRRFLPLSFASTAKTSTRAEKGLHCSHNNYIPHLLRMTVGVGFVVTLSKAGRTVLSIGIHSKTPAASNFREWCKPERKAKNACIF